MTLNEESCFYKSFEKNIIKFKDLFERKVLSLSVPLSLKGLLDKIQVGLLFLLYLGSLKFCPSNFIYKAYTNLIVQYMTVQMDYIIHYTLQVLAN